jgi:hypothetical protein
MGRACAHDTVVLPLSISPVRVTMRWLGDVVPTVHEEHEALPVADRLARVTPPAMAAPSTGDADQSIHAPLMGI